MFNKRNAQMLRKAGFLPEEIDRFNSMVDPAGRPQDVNSLIKTGPWQAMIAARRNYWQQERKRKISDAAIAAKIRAYYRAFTKRKPWDFLKREYHPPRRITDFQAYARGEASRRIMHHFGKHGKGRYPVKGFVGR